MIKILSIIIPSYNMEAYLQRCLDSIVVEDIDKLDIIIVNDGSKDTTSAIAHSYREKYPNSINVIDKKNGNYGSCINAALPLIKGKYVKVLDADDTFFKSNLNEYIRYLEASTSDLIINDYVTVNEDDKITGKFSFYFDGITEKELSFKQSLPIICQKDFQMHAVAYRADLFKQFDYNQTEGISYTDMEWMFLPMTHVNTVKFFDNIIYKYLIGRAGQTISTSISRKAVNQTTQVVSNLLKQYAACISNIDGSHISYLQYRISIVAPSLYRIILLKQEDKSLYSDLRDFDVVFKETYPELYAKMDDETIKVLPFHFIRYWRKYRKSDKALWPFRLLSFIISRIV